MKNVLKLNKLLFLLTFSFFIISCDNDDNDEPTEQVVLTIVETAAATPELSILVDALTAADGDLLTTLSGGDFTVLAPTNDAFAGFLSANGFASLDEVPTDVLSNILLNHVITGSVMSTDLASAGSGYTTTNATNMDGDNLSLYFSTSSGVEFNGQSSVVLADIPATNGIVHVVDAVIGLPTVVTFATSNPTFETLVAALTRDDLSQDFVSILSTTDEPSPFTVFAPTNDAFASLLSELGVDSLGDIDAATLELTLATHVVVEANVRSGDLTNGMNITTIGDGLTVSLDAGPQLIDLNDRIANIIAVDVQAYNGVVHVIDKVVLPQL
ncbi:fasciclin domain-containing protein [Flavobacteriaceae bacterium]|nr:fasciclin domain-containing protein [Flavobacteriaceae bacterium]MDB2321494.1 fasciclin domain-containing protein [Flavobacteriaceae bacterium]